MVGKRDDDADEPPVLVVEDVSSGAARSKTEPGDASRVPGKR